jgi:hypothetical protein
MGQHQKITRDGWDAQPTPVVPAYTLTITHADRISESGHLRVENPDDLAAAMKDWLRRWEGYNPRCHADGEDACLARWSRWNTCE